MGVELLLEERPVVLEESGREPKIQLTDDHKREIFSLNRILDSAGGLPYVVLGSLGVAVSSGSEWSPFKPSREGGLRDIDIFLITDEDSRAKVRTEIKDDLQLIESVEIFHKVLQVRQGEPYLVYKDVVIPVDRQLIQVFNLRVEDLEIPVLHPKTYLYLMTHVTPLELLYREAAPTIYAKMEQRTEELVDAVEENLLGFPVIQDKWLDESFGWFRREMKKRHPIHSLKLELRRLVYQWEREDRYEEIVKLRNYLKEQWPWLVNFMRE
jgi:hypothetical protein